MAGLDYQAFKRCLAGERLPVALVDLDAFDRNTARVLDALAGHPLSLRPASKSIRSVTLLKRLLNHPSGKIRGVLCYSAQEAVQLAQQGIDDLLVAYPVYQRADADALAALSQAGAEVSVACDNTQSLRQLARAALAQNTELRVVVCVDMSLRLLGGRVHLGVRRSPLHSPEQVWRFAKQVAETRGLVFHGVLAYEAQVAGLADANPFNPWLNPAKRLIKALSVRELKRRREELVQGLIHRGLKPRLVNGGGTGSLDSSSREASLSEVSAGSAFFKSHLFDYYPNAHMRRLEPAAFFALEITRIPGDGFVTCSGGGYIASGSIGPEKAPIVHAPEGLSLLSSEAAGEVQTPLRIPSALKLRLEPGDPVVFRHSKAGELAEHFNHFLLVESGQPSGRARTYRGEGWSFL